MSQLLQRPALVKQSIRPTALSNRRRTKVNAANFDENAAQVRRLLDRDRKELNFDELEKTFLDPDNATSAAADTPATKDSSNTTDNITSTSGNSSKPISPFGPSSTTPTSPFGNAVSSRKPLSEPAGLSPTTGPIEMETKPWWTKITLTQIVIVLSFTTIISLMIATFFVVVKMGGVHFNE